jgi:superfamily II DNA or RNA helicase
MNAPFEHSAFGGSVAARQSSTRRDEDVGGDHVMALRTYQDHDFDQLRSLFAQGCKRICYAAPTGSGKTVLFCHAVQKVSEKNRRVVILVHRQELIEQTCEALTAVGIAFGVIANGWSETPDALVQVAMAQTLVNRLGRLRDVHFLVVDEAHHIVASTWRIILAALADALVLGSTATPERLDGQGLAEMFDALVIGPSVKDLIAGGWLSPFAVFAPARMVNLKGIRSVAGDYALGDLAARMNTDTSLADVITEYRKHLVGKTAIAFCTTIAHSLAAARFFRDAGIRAEHLDGDTPRQERRDILRRLETGETSIVTNCSLISEGLDISSVGGVILLRPTKSLAVYLQQIGRALRPAPGKERAIILDHSGNVFRHGLPDLEHAWSLEGRPKQKGDALVKRCPECGALIPLAARECPECGADLRPVRPRPTPNPLIELDPATAHERWLATGSFKAVTDWAGTNEARLRQVAAARGYKPGWVWHRLNQPYRRAADAALLRAIDFN